MLRKKHTHQKQISRPRTLSKPKKASSYRCGDLKNVKLPPRRVLAEICRNRGLQKEQKNVRNGSRMDDMGNRDRENDRTGSRITFRPLPDPQNLENRLKNSKMSQIGPKIKNVVLNQVGFGDLGPLAPKLLGYRRHCQLKPIARSAQRLQ